MSINMATSTSSELTNAEMLNAVRNKNSDVIKQIATADFTDGGQLNRQQFAEFYQEVQDETVALDLVRTVPLNGPQYQIDKIGVGERQLRSVGEGSSATLRGISTGSVDLDVVKTSLPYELTRETVEDTIEYENTAEIILSHFTQQYGVDTEDLAFNGDESFTDGGSATEEFLTINDGWLKIASDRGAPYVDGGNETVDTEKFYTMAQLVDDKYHREGNNRFFMSRKNALEYKKYLSQRETDLGDQNIQDGEFMTPVGYPVTISPVMPHDQVLFADPQNLIHAVHRDMRVDVTTESERVVMNDLFAQYNLTSRFDFEIEETEGVALMDNIASGWA